MFDINEKGVIVVKPEYLILKPFAEIKKKYKNYLEVLTYVYFIADFKSEFRKRYDEKDLHETICTALEITVNAKDTDIITAIEFYKDLQKTKSLQLFTAAENTLGQITKYFNDFKLEDFSEDKKDEAVARIMKNLSSVGTLAKNLEDARKTVEQELMNNNNRNKGGIKIKKREIPKNR